MSFRQVGQDISGAIDFYQEAQEKKKKQSAIQDYVARQLARLPPEKQMEAQALLAGPAAMPGAPAPLPATTMMDGTPDAPIPPEISGAGAPVNDLFAPPGPDLNAMAQPKPDPGAESLRMLLEATRDNVMEPKGLFDYIAGIGKQDVIGDNRMSVEQLKESLRRDLQQNDLQARLDRLERVLENKKQLNDDDNTTSAENNKRTNTTRTAVADKGNATRKEIASTRPAGKGGKDPDAMTPEEIDAELEVYGARADSLSNAAGDPKAVGYKPAEEKFATIDESNRQKDLSKTMERATTLKAAKARKLAGGSGTRAPGTAAPGAGAKTYTSKGAIQADIAAGLIQPGQKVQFKMPDGSTVLVNTAK
jgi:hypothetical protein